MKSRSPGRRLQQASTCAAKLKVLSDPTRMRVLEALRAGPRHVNVLMKKLKIEQSLLSHHLQALREAGLVQAERDGKSVLYSLSAVAAGGEAIDLGCCRIVFE